MGTFSSIRGHLALLPFVVTLNSCGDKATETACGGIESNGVCFYVSAIQPTYRGGNTNRVDTTLTAPNPAYCDSGELPISAHMANVSIGAVTLGGQTTNVTRIIINSYTVTYVAVSDPTAPAIAPLDSPEIFEIAVGSTATKTLELFSEAQKDAFDATGNSSYPFYDVTFTFNAEDEYGRKTFATGKTQIVVGDFLQDECAPAPTP
jgi:hypothetical protein